MKNEIKKKPMWLGPNIPLKNQLGKAELFQKIWYSITEGHYSNEGIPSLGEECLAKVSEYNYKVNMENEKEDFSNLSD